LCDFGREVFKGRIEVDLEDVEERRGELEA